MAALNTALEALGWTQPQQQAAMVQLLCFCGKGGELRVQQAHKGHMPGEHQALAIARNPRLFPSAAEALDWLEAATQELFYTTRDYASLKFDAGFYGRMRHAILPLLTQLGMRDARMPEQTDYDYLLVPGGNEAWARLRMQQMKTLLADGIRPKQVVLLGSTRLLMPELEKESLTALLGERLAQDGKPLASAAIEAVIEDAVSQPAMLEIKDIYARNLAQTKAILAAIGADFTQWPTEADMLGWLYKDMQGKSPTLQSTPANTVCSPMIGKQGEAVTENTAENIQRLLNGELRRANTRDTFRDFADSDVAAHGGSVLSISHQPYALHQHGQLLAALPEDRFRHMETAAEEVPLEAINVHHALGCLAKYIYAVRPQMRQELASRAALSQSA